MKISAKKYAVVLYQAVTEAKDSDQLLVDKNFVALLSQQNQLALVPQIIEAFEQRWLAGQGGVKVEITTAAPLSTKNFRFGRRPSSIQGFRFVNVAPSNPITMTRGLFSFIAVSA